MRWQVIATPFARRVALCCCEMALPRACSDICDCFLHSTALPCTFIAPAATLGAVAPPRAIMPLGGSPLSAPQGILTSLLPPPPTAPHRWQTHAQMLAAFIGRSFQEPPLRTQYCSLLEKLLPCDSLDALVKVGEGQSTGAGGKVGRGQQDTGRSAQRRRAR